MIYNESLPVLRSLLPRTLEIVPHSELLPWTKLIEGRAER